MINAFTVVYGIAALIGLLLMAGIVASGQLLNGGTALFGIGFLLFLISVRGIKARVVA